MNDSLEIFLHGRGAPQVVAARGDETLREVLVRESALPADAEFVFVGLALDDCEGVEEDTHAPADLHRTLIELGIVIRGHVHTRATHRVHVTVFFNGDHKSHRFSPAATIERVTTWAKRKFNIDAHGGADLVLAIKPSGVQPRADEHLGELLERGNHALEFDLVREVTPQG